MRLGRKLAVGVAEEGERIPDPEVTREDVGVLPHDEAEVIPPSEARPSRETFAGSNVNS